MKDDERSLMMEGCRLCEVDVYRYAVDEDKIEKDESRNF